MNVQMMDGLLGASSNIKLSGTPISVYRQASAEGDTEKMKRALGYTGECAEKAVKYQEKLDEGMKGTMADYQIGMVSETPLMDVYPYSAGPNDKPEFDPSKA